MEINGICIGKAIGKPEKGKEINGGCIGKAIGKQEKGKEINGSSIDSWKNQASQLQTHKLSILLKKLSLWITFHYILGNPLRASKNTGKPPEQPHHLQKKTFFL